ncbi:MAG TPA: hypothetical protein VF183_09470 [Acidimicrobiales bacterium]
MTILDISFTKAPARGRAASDFAAGPAQPSGEEVAMGAHRHRMRSEPFPTVGEDRCAEEAAMHIEPDAGGEYDPDDLEECDELTVLAHYSFDEDADAGYEDDDVMG